jgi:modulator of FtsH protease
MLEAMSVGDWEAFYSAQLGAAAALGGLVFVGLSLNLAKILTNPVLPNRALLALLVLLAILIVSSFALMPGQSHRALGAEIVAVGSLVIVTGTWIELHGLRNLELQSRRTFIATFVLFELGVLPFVIGGALILLGLPAGLYWVAAGVIVSFVKAVLDAWVLLVEINR